MDGLDGDAGGLEELRRVGVGGRDVWGEARTLIEPVGLAEFADDAAVGGEVAEDAFADITNRMGEGGAGLPVAVEHGGVVEGEGRLAGEAGEVEFGRREDAGLDGTLVGPEFGLRELSEETGPLVGRKLADVPHDGGGAVESGGEARCVVGFSPKELGIVDLELADFIRVGRRDASTGRAAGFVAEDVDAVVLPSEVEDAMGDVTDHATFVDE